MGLRPLAFNLDNGWSSKIAVSNIKSLTNDLGVDLETYVINYEEVKIALRSYMNASLPWVDGATDRAIKSSIYRTAYKEGITSILVKQILDQKEGNLMNGHIMMPNYFHIY